MQIALCDGSSLGNPGPSKIGVVYWERFVEDKVSTRRFKPTLTISEAIGRRTNNDAEWLAVLRAMKIVHEKKGRDPVFIYSDSMLVVEQINGRWKARQENTKLYLDQFCYVRQTAADRGQSITVTWLPRQLTYLADKEATRSGSA